MDVGKNLRHCRYETIECLFALGFRWLYQQTLRYQERKISRGRVKTTIEQRLGEVHCGDVVLLGLSPKRHNEFMASPATRKCEIKTRILKLRHDVICVQSRVICHTLHTLMPEHSHVDVSPQQYSRITHKRRQAADAFGAIRLTYPTETITLAAHDRRREERLKLVTNANGPRTGSTPTVRRGERLVQIDVNDVETHIARQRLTQDGVELGSIVVEQPPGSVNDFRDIPYPPLKNTQGGGVGKHNPRSLGSDAVLQGIDVNVSIRACPQLGHRTAAHGGGGWIRPMGRVGDYDLRSADIAAINLVHYHAAREADHALSIHCEFYEERGATLVTVIAADHPGLFYRIAGGIHLAGGNIIDARIHTSRDGWAVDNFHVQDPHGRPFMEEGQLERLKTHSRSKAFDVDPRIVFDNKASNRFTVIEVNARDRSALLNRLSRALFEEGLVVQSAHITAYGERAADTFYVTDVTGSKITGEARLARIEAALLEAASDALQARLEDA